MSGTVLTKVLQRAVLMSELMQDLTQEYTDRVPALVFEAVEAGNNLRRFVELGDAGWSEHALRDALHLADTLRSLAETPEHAREDGFRKVLRRSVDAVLLTMPTLWHSSQASLPRAKTPPPRPSGLNSLSAPNNAFDVVILQALKVVNDLLEAESLSESLQNYPNVWTLDTVCQALREELAKFEATGWSEEGMSNIRRLATLLGNRKRYPEDAKFIQAAAHLGTRVLLSMPDHFRLQLGDRIPRLIEELGRPKGR